MTTKGISQPVELYSLEWRDRRLYPTRVRIRETGQILPLPDRDTVTFGRLREKDGLLANDIIIELPDEQQTRQISRWHCELRRHLDGYHLRAVSSHPTEVDGTPLARGAQVPIRPGFTVRLSRVVTIEFLGEEIDRAYGGETIQVDEE